MTLKTTQTTLRRTVRRLQPGDRIFWKTGEAADYKTDPELLVVRVTTELADVEDDAVETTVELRGPRGGAYEIRTGRDFGPSVYLVTDGGERHSGRLEWIRVGER